MWNELRRQVWDSDAFGLVVVTRRDDLYVVIAGGTLDVATITSMISFLGKERSGISAALQAIR